MPLDRLDLRPVLPNATVARDDHPAARGDLWDPHVVGRRGGRDRARLTASPVHLTSRISGTGDVRTKLVDDLGQTQHVRVEVEADLGRLDLRGHAARSADS
jgi:hypothetical protein